MLFNSYPFILGFLPAVLLGYAVLSESRWRAATPWLLIAASLFFYAWWNWHYLSLFGFSIAFNFLWCDDCAAGSGTRLPAAERRRRDPVRRRDRR